MSIELLQNYKPLLDWLEAHRSWAVVVVALVLLRAGWVLLGRFWDWLLSREEGAYWPLPASLLPVVAALMPNFMDIGTQREQYAVILSVLLGAIAVLQVYGQAREKRYRKLVDARIDRIGAGVRGVSTGIKRYRELADARFERIGAGVGGISSGVRGISTELRALSTDINSIATATAERLEEEELNPQLPVENWVSGADEK